MLCYQKIEPVGFNECTRIMTAAFDWDTALHTDLLHDGPRGYDGRLVDSKALQRPFLPVLQGPAGQKDDWRLCPDLPKRLRHFGPSVSGPHPWQPVIWERNLAPYRAESSVHHPLDGGNTQLLHPKPSFLHPEMWLSFY